MSAHNSSAAAINCKRRTESITKFKEYISERLPLGKVKL
jgi:hypothetical protein